MPRLLAILLLSVLSVLPALPSWSQEGAPSMEIGEAQRETYVETRARLAEAAVRIEELSASVDAAKRDDFRLADLKLQIEAVGKAVLDLSVRLQPRFSAVTKRLGEIGDPPAADQPPEDPILTADRKRLTAEKAEINTLTSEAEAISTRASDLANHVTDIRRELFAETILARTELTMTMVSDTISAFRAEASDLVRAVSSWAKFAWNFKRMQLLGALALAVIVGLAFMQGAYRSFNPLFHRSRAVENPPYIRRLSIAFWSTVIPSLSVLVYGALFLFFMVSFNVLRPDIGEMLGALITVIIAIYFVWRLSQSVLAPRKAQWRLINVSDRGARLLSVLVVLLAVINGVDYALEEFTRTLDSPVVLTIAKGFVAAVLTGVVLLVMSFVKPMNSAGSDDAVDAVAAASSRRDGRWPRLVAYLLRGAGLFLIGAAGLGYVGLARFVSTQIVISGAFAVTMYIGILSGRAVATRGAFAKTAAGRWLDGRYGLTPVRLDQVGLLAGLAIYVMVLVVGLPLLLLQWGFQIHDIQGMAIRLFTEIRIGSITISLFGLMGGVIVFAIGLVVTRWFQRWLDGTVMDRSQVDSGVRNSVNTALGYAGVGLAGLLGVSAAGIDLSSLALVAGALSLGIGFGLQNIVSNFVSGLILLAERPFKVGDWVVTGKTEGFVKRISVRATEIETFQHQSIIVPNAELINASLGNWTHRNKMGRSEIAVGVSYDADPRKVMDILLELANAHPLVLKTPEPTVAFLGFGDFALNFELRIYLADLLNGTQVRNELRLAIFERFRDEAIEIPYPQRNLNIRFEGDPPADDKSAAQPSPADAGKQKLRAAARAQAMATSGPATTAQEG